MLFVDDEKKVLKAFERSFYREPFEIITAESAEAALDLISSKELDLIVTDIKMPGIHGLELIEKIRKRDYEIPIIIYTAYSKMREDAVVKMYNIEAYYTKPNDYNRLYTKIKEMAAFSNPSSSQD